jgi:hypothetical protein
VAATLSFGYNGDRGVGDRLLVAVLRGEKTATSSLAAAEWRREHEAFRAEVADLVRADAGDSEWQLRACEPVVVHLFRLVEPTER